MRLFNTGWGGACARAGMHAEAAMRTTVSAARPNLFRLFRRADGFAELDPLTGGSWQGLSQSSRPADSAAAALDEAKHCNIAGMVVRTQRHRNKIQDESARTAELCACTAGPKHRTVRGMATRIVSWAVTRWPIRETPRSPFEKGGGGLGFESRGKRLIPIPSWMHHFGCPRRTEDCHKSGDPA